MRDSERGGNLLYSERWQSHTTGPTPVAQPTVDCRRGLTRDQHEMAFLFPSRFVMHLLLVIP